jgi:hypothetical protein
VTATGLQAKPDPLVIDVIGAGEDLTAIQEYAASKGLVWNWMGGKDHADSSMHDYQVGGVCADVYACGGRGGTERGNCAGGDNLC